MIGPIERFRANAPTRPYCTDDLCRGVRVLPRGAALKTAYIQANLPWFRKYLPLDVDQKAAALLPDQLGLPPPTIITVNPDTTHAHFLFELAVPAWSGNPKSDAYFRIVRRALALAYGADLAYVGLLIQNPLSPRWRCREYDKVYTLTELAIELPADLLKIARELPIRRFASANPPDVTSRNCDCFEFVRHIGYRLTRECASPGELCDRVLAFCRERNSGYLPPMRESELRWIAKSVARWCWNRRESLIRRRRDGKRRGILELPQDLSLAERQRQGARFIHQQRGLKTSQRIEQVLKTVSYNAGITTIAKAANVSTRTVRRYLQKNALTAQKCVLSKTSSLNAFTQDQQRAFSDTTPNVT
jgi:hypothetical protein